MREDRGLTEALSYGISRSPRWPGVEKEHLKLEPTCRVCGKSATQAPLQVHHRYPFFFAIHLGRPDLELDQRNLVTLCETEKDRPADDHHLLIGHLDNFKSSNLNVVEDSVTFHGMTSDQIKADPRWLADEKKRMKPLSEMTDDDKRSLRALMDATFPLPPGTPIPPIPSGSIKG